MKMLKVDVMRKTKELVPMLIVLTSLLLFFGCSTMVNSSTLSYQDKKNLTSVHNYLLLVENNLGKWNNLAKAEESLGYAKEAYSELSPAAVSSVKGVQYALDIKSKQAEIEKRKKLENS